MLRGFLLCFPVNLRNFKRSRRFGLRFTQLSNKVYISVCVKRSVREEEQKIKKRRQKQTKDLPSVKSTGGGETLTSRS